MNLYHYKMTTVNATPEGSNESQEYDMIFDVLFPKIIFPAVKFPCYTVPKMIGSFVKNHTKHAFRIGLGGAIGAGSVFYLADTNMGDSRNDVTNVLERTIGEEDYLTAIQGNGINTVFSVSEKGLTRLSNEYDSKAEEISGAYDELRKSEIESYDMGMNKAREILEAGRK